jgi:hypothetical protein
VSQQVCTERLLSLLSFPKEFVLAKKFLNSCALAGCLALTIAAIAGDSQAPSSSSVAALKNAADEFKNIQVLKAIPADQLIPTMQFINSSLGVECDFCHVEREMDKDDKKPKKTAREMMKMMATINQNNFQGEREVTCNTCHRGFARPQAIPAILEKANPPAAEHDTGNHEDLASWPSGDSALAKYIEVVGGAEVVGRVTTRVEKGHALMPGGHSVPIEILAQSPDRRVSILHTVNGDSVTGYNGKDGWLAAPGRPVQEMSTYELPGARLDAVVFFPAHLAELFQELKRQPLPEQISSRTATLVVGLNKGQPPVNLYFEEQSGLLIRMVHYTDTALGLFPTQVDLSDYRDSGGAKTPFRWTIARPSGSFTIQLDAVQSQVPIGAERFAKPSTLPPVTAAAPSSH